MPQDFIYLPGNNSGIWRLRAEGFPVGMMFSPDGVRKPVRNGAEIPYAVDNGLYHQFGTDPKPAAARARIYSVLSRIELEQWPAPLFAVVPDCPYDARETYRLIAAHAPLMREMFPRVPLALAVQDGMQPAAGAWIAWREYCAWIFVAGSDAWKEATAPEWVSAARNKGLKVHLARANETKRIEIARRAGCDSADGTGIWRGDNQQKSRVLRAITQELMFLGWERKGAA